VKCKNINFFTILAIMRQISPSIFIVERPGDYFFLRREKNSWYFILNINIHGKICHCFFVKVSRKYKINILALIIQKYIERRSSAEILSRGNTGNKEYVLFLVHSFLCISA